MIKTKLRVSLRTDHTCNCGACIEIPKLSIEGVMKGNKAIRNIDVYLEVEIDSIVYSVETVNPAPVATTDHLVGRYDMVEDEVLSSATVSEDFTLRKISIDGNEIEGLMYSEDELILYPVDSIHGIMNIILCNICCAACDIVHRGLDWDEWWDCFCCFYIDGCRPCPTCPFAGY